jgi:outer membrane protein OmpA-like peptidoglycan-associated protein
MLRAPHRAFALAAAALALISAFGEARAQSGGKPRGALDQLDPAPAGDAFFSLPSAEVAGRLRISAQLLASYAHDPLVLRHSSGGAPLEWVRDQALLHVQASVEAFRLLKLDLDIPATIAAGGTSGSLGNVSVTAPSGTAAGDLRVGLRAALLHQDGFVPAASLGFTVWAPVGNATSLSGAGVIRYQPTVSIGAEYAHFVWGASVGARFQGASSTSLIGSQIVGGAGAAVRWFGLAVGPELRYDVGTGDAPTSAVKLSTGAGAEVLIGARYTLGPMVFGLAGGPGFGRGAGTPTYRLLASITGTFDALPVHDPSEGSGRGAGDGDAATKRKSLPPAPAAPLDTDGDGVPDAEDACPTIVGDASPGAYRRGCPPDRDRDGIFDADDRCPDVPGVESADPAKNGCPPDTDGDGIPDDKDACPREKGEPSADPKKNGCPTAVRIEGTQIVILQQVNFETGRDEIKADSFDLLGQVAAVMRDHPEIARVAVDGHTDNRGGDKPNVNLSERRAVAVVRWLTEHGVDARRLEARGFGARRPIADNKTEAGRAKNRRVEFQIRRRAPEGEAGWRDGPVEEAPR